MMPRVEAAEIGINRSTHNKPINFAPSAPDAAKLRQLLKRYTHEDNHHVGVNIIMVNK